MSQTLAVSLWSMETTMKTAPPKAARLAACFVAFLMAAPVLSAPTLKWTVDCSRGQSIGRALEHAPPGFKLTLTVRGTCNEAVVIERDDVTLQGDAVTGAVINAPRLEIGITVRAMRVLIDRMTVQGGNDGIMVYGVMDTYVTNTTIRDVARWGLVSKNAHAFVRGCTVERSGLDGISLQRGSARLVDCQIRANHGAGIGGGNASGLNISGSTVASNGSDGIWLDMSSQATIHDDNTITSNGLSSTAPGAGVNVTGGSTVEISGSAITNNAGPGLRLYGKAYATATKNTITGNGSNGVEAYGSSHASLSGNTIAGNGTKAPNDPNFVSGVVVHTSNLDLSGNQIASHPGTGVRASAATVTSYENTITGNAGGGVLLYPASQLVMNNDIISRNGAFGLVLSLNSVAQLLGANVQFNSGDGITLQYGSKLNFVAAASTSGGNSGYGLQCVDPESSVVGAQMLTASPPNGQGGVSPGCTGF